MGGGGGPRLHFVPANFAHQMPLHPYLVSSVCFSYRLALFVSLFICMFVLCSDPTLDSHVLSMVIISLTDMRPLFVFGFYVEISFPYSCTFV